MTSRRLVYVFQTRLKRGRFRPFEDVVHLNLNLNRNRSTPLSCGLVASLALTGIISTYLVRCEEKELGFGDKRLLFYENRLRANASPEKVFKYFATVTENGVCHMTPQDLVRSLTPSAFDRDATPINKKWGNEVDQRKVAVRSSADEPLGFFSFGDNNNPGGLISYGRYLVFLMLLSTPPRDLDIAFKMMDTSRSNTLSLGEFEEMLHRHEISRAGYGFGFKKGALLQYLFGPELDGALSFHDFKTFCAELRAQLLRLEFDLYSPDENNTIPVEAYARSLVSHAPPSRLKELTRRVGQLRDMELFRDERFSFEDFAAFDAVVCEIPALSRAIRIYSDRSTLTRDNFCQAARAVSDVELKPLMVELLLHLFAADSVQKLFESDFESVVKRRRYFSMLTDREDGLGVVKLGGCLKACVENWYSGSHGEGDSSNGGGDEER